MEVGNFVRASISHPRLFSYLSFSAASSPMCAERGNINPVKQMYISNILWKEPEIKPPFVPTFHLIKRKYNIIKLEYFTKVECNNKLYNKLNEAVVIFCNIVIFLEMKRLLWLRHKRNKFLTIAAIRLESWTRDY